MRSFIVIIGPKGKSHVPSLYDLMDLKTNRSVLWACKNRPAGSQQKKPKRNAKGEGKPIDPVDAFVTQKDVRHVLYKETEKILGNTYGMCVLQDFEAVTPNILARTIETVEGGGVIVLLLSSVTSLEQLSTLTMDAHSRYRTEAFNDVKARFNERFAQSLKSCETCMVVDDELNVLQSSEPIMIDQAGETAIEGPALVRLAKTADQAKALTGFMEAIVKKTNQTVTLTAGRGRGKSAALGLSIAAAVASGYSNIFITSPSPENLKTLFQFIVKGLNTLEYTEKEYDQVRSNGSVVRINITKGIRQTIQYISPNVPVQGQAELVVIDEAAAIPLPLVKNLLGPYLVFMASTINGYEGTGRSLSLKLIKDLRDQKKSKERRTLKEITLDEPIRYSAGDLVEKWLNTLLCLDAVVGKSLEEPLKPAECGLYYINRDSLFSFTPESEVFLNKVMALYVASHYKNSPNDLQLLSDAPAHQMYVLMASEEPVCVVQLALEGGISKTTVRNTLSRGQRAGGDLIPWLVAQQFQDEDFATLVGARVVRIATHPDYMSMGYGAQALRLLQEHFQTEKQTKLGQKSGLLTAIGDITPPFLHYLGVSYGLTGPLNKFWKKAGFAPVYLRQSSNEVTGEHSCIMLKVLEGRSKEWLGEFTADFHKRFVNLLTYEFSKFTAVQALSILEGTRLGTTKTKKINKQDLDVLMSGTDLKRLDAYSNNLVDYAVIVDMLPLIARLYFNNQLPAELSGIQSVILLGAGLQKKDMDFIGAEMGVSVTQILALFTAAIRKLTKVFREL